MGKGGDTRGIGVFLVRIATCQFSLGAFILLGLVCFDVGILGRADSCVAQSPCLSVWVTPLTCPYTRRPEFVCVSECVCSVSVCVYTECATPCLKSTVRPIPPLPFSASYQSLNNSSHNSLLLYPEISSSLPLLGFFLKIQLHC